MKERFDWASWDDSHSHAQTLHCHQCTATNPISPHQDLRNLYLNFLRLNWSLMAQPDIMCKTLTRTCLVSQAYSMLLEWLSTSCILEWFIWMGIKVISFFFLSFDAFDLSLFLFLSLCQMSLSTSSWCPSPFRFFLFLCHLFSFNFLISIWPSDDLSWIRWDNLSWISALNCVCDSEGSHWKSRRILLQFFFWYCVCMCVRAHTYAY